MKQMDFPTYEEFKKIVKQLSGTRDKLGVYSLGKNISMDIEIVSPSEVEFRVFVHYQNTVDIFKQIQVTKAFFNPGRDGEREYDNAVQYLKAEVELLGNILR